MRPDLLAHTRLARRQQLPSLGGEARVDPMAVGNRTKEDNGSNPASSGRPRKTLKERAQRRRRKAMKARAAQRRVATVAESPER